MHLISREDLQDTLDYASLIDAIDTMFRDGCTTPVRHHHSIETPDGINPTLLLMPAWREGDVIGVKIATVFPENGARDLPAVMGSYMLIDGNSGTPLAMLDGTELTARRTASASGVASRYLSREDSSTLLMVGTGVLAPHLIRAHATVRPIRNVLVWGRNPEKAEAVVQGLAGESFSVCVAASLKEAVPKADIISCATLSRAPLIHGKWLLQGQHLDLVGGFTPEMREADDECVKRARIYCDTRAGAMKEAGDLVQPLAGGAIVIEDIIGDLFEMSRGQCPLREDADEITYFKSAGTALEDLAAAKLAFKRLSV
ncbi:MAG: ornithine cyclodeaminase family protein [Rhodospirillales bacterium]|nr:ornithine cyclodeaminase family protein [Rhodospirillales bacterium]